MKMTRLPSANRLPRRLTATISGGAATTTESVENNGLLAVAGLRTWSKKHESVTQCKDSKEHKQQRSIGQHTISSAAESCTNKTCGTGSGRLRQQLKRSNKSTARPEHQAAMAVATRTATHVQHLPAPPSILNDSLPAAAHSTLKHTAKKKKKRSACSANHLDCCQKDCARSV